MSEDRVEFENFNFCKNLSREKLEAIVNSLIAPIIDEKELFLESKPTSSSLEERLRFWIRLLAVFAENFGGPTAIFDLQFPNLKKLKLEAACSRLSQEQINKCNSIIRQYKQDHAHITVEHEQHNSAVLDYRWHKRSVIESKYESMISEILMGTEIQGADCDFGAVTQNEWNGLSREVRERVLHAMNEKEREMSKITGPGRKPCLSEIETSPVFLEYGKAYVTAHEQLSKLLGSDNAQTALGDLPNATFDFMKSVDALKNCFEQLSMELTFIVNGEISDAAKALTTRSRGDRKDSAVLKDLKDGAGLVYRALRYSNARSDQAVDLINGVLADQNLKSRRMTKDAIIKRAPGNLSKFHPRSWIHRDRPLVAGQQLPRYLDECYDDCLYRHAEKWLMPYIKEYFHHFRN